MSDKVTNLFNRLGVQSAGETVTPSESVAAPPPTEKTEYRAADPFLGNEPTRRLRVYYNTGKWEIFSYFQLSNVLSNDPYHLALIFTSGTVELLGENLRELFDGFQDEAIKTLHHFDGNRHLEPTTGVPVIDTIRFYGQYDTGTEPQA